MLLKVNHLLFRYASGLTFCYDILLIFLSFESLQESNSLPAPKVDGDDRQRARALATIHSHPVVSLSFSFKFHSAFRKPNSLIV